MKTQDEDIKQQQARSTGTDDVPEAPGRILRMLYSPLAIGVGTILLIGSQTPKWPRNFGE
jgi:hypothetical protein